MALDQKWEGWVRARREVGFGDSAQLMGGPRSFGRRVREYPSYGALKKLFTYYCGP